MADHDELELWCDERPGSLSVVIARCSCGWFGYFSLLGESPANCPNCSRGLVIRNGTDAKRNHLPDRVCKLGGWISLLIKTAICVIWCNPLNVSLLYLQAARSHVQINQTDTEIIVGEVP